MRDACRFLRIVLDACNKHKMVLLSVDAVCFECCGRTLPAGCVICICPECVLSPIVLTLSESAIDSIAMQLAIISVSVQYSSVFGSDSDTAFSFFSSDVSFLGCTETDDAYHLITFCNVPLCCVLTDTNIDVYICFFFHSIVG